VYTGSSSLHEWKQKANNNAIIPWIIRAGPLSSNPLSFKLAVMFSCQFPSSLNRIGMDTQTGYRLLMVCAWNEAVLFRCLNGGIIQFLASLLRTRAVVIRSLFASTNTFSHTVPLIFSSSSADSGYCGTTNLHEHGCIRLGSVLKIVAKQVHLPRYRESICRRSLRFQRYFPCRRAVQPSEMVFPPGP